MGSRKETRTRGFHSASAPFRQAYKRRASSSQQVRNWAQHTFTGEFNQSRYVKFFALTFVVLALGGGLVVWSRQPGNGLFHNYKCGSESKASGSSSPCDDPTTFIWAGTKTGEFNQVNAAFAVCSNGLDCWKLSPTATQSAIVLTKSPVGEIGLAAAKTLAIQLSWILGTTTVNRFDSWGYYLTTNSTVPTQNGYDPSKDHSVGLEVQVICDQAGGCAYNGANNYDTEIYSLRSQTGGDTISLESTGGCPGGISGTSVSASSCFLSTVQNLSFNTNCPNNAACNAVFASTDLNYTATTNGTTSCSIVSNGLIGPGCSWIQSYFGPNFFTGVQANGVQTLPFFNLQGQWFLGMFALSSNAAGMSAYFPFTANGGANPTNGIMDILYYVPAPTAAVQPPNIDTGGFFGPIIKALISIGVFIANNIINFLSFLYNALAPLLAGAATIIGNVLTAVMNALGTIFGDSSLGTQISTAFSQIVGYLTNVFSSAVAIWGNILTALLNILNFVTQFLTITVNGGATLFNFIENFFSTLQNFWTVLVGVWNQFMKFYIAGTFTIQYILVVWWIWGMYENFKRGVKGGLIEGWLQPSETFLLALFKGGYWFLDEAYAFVVQLKQLIFGNRISPGTIAGNG